MSAVQRAEQAYGAPAVPVPGRGRLPSGMIVRQPGGMDFVVLPPECATGSRRSVRIFREGSDQGVQARFAPASGNRGADVRQHTRHFPETE
jgi:hypothetical protein